jgi:hypothetical protein
MTCDPCECVIKEGERAAWCPRHKVWKNKHWIHLCHTRPGYRKAWEEGRGPGQNLPKGPPTPLFKIPEGPGTELRRILGCSAKKWPHYKEMNRLGNLCEHHIKELAKSLVGTGYLRTEANAERVIQLAIDKAESRASRRKAQYEDASAK